MATLTDGDDDLVLSIHDDLSHIFLPFFFFFLLFASTHTPWIYLVLAFGLGRRE